MNTNNESMPFLDHLEELRWRLIKSISSVLIGAIASFYFIDHIIEILIKPTENLNNSMDLQVLKVQGMFMIKWGIALLGGIIISIPVLTYQLWKFIAPGLYLDEKKYIIPLILFSFEISFVIILLFFTIIGFFSGIKKLLTIDFSITSEVILGFFGGIINSLGYNFIGSVKKNRFINNIILILSFIKY